MKRIMLAVSGLARGFLIFCVRAYQVVISPHLGNCCRFEPSCSAYCIEAIQKHGVIRGGWLAARRVLRCRPFGPSGFDPVPPARGGSMNDHRNNGQRSSYRQARRPQSGNKRESNWNFQRSTFNL